jgi:hypothetical protein
MMTPSYELACSIAKPFECSACIPDGSSGTGCFSVKVVNQLTTGTGGVAGFILSPQNTNAMYYNDSSGTATTTTISGNWAQATKNSTIAALYGDIRTVSAGIRAYYTGPTTTDQGIIVVGQLPAGIGISAMTGWTFTQLLSQTQYYKVFPIRSGAEISWRPQCMNDVDTWNDTGTGTVSTATDQNVPLIFVYIFGAAASTSNLVFIDSVVNFEGEFNSQTFMPGGSNESSKNNLEMGWYEKAKGYLKGVEPILPYVASMVSGAASYLTGEPAVGSLLNGVFGQLTNQELPKRALYSSPRLTITEM